MVYYAAATFIAHTAIAIEMATADIDMHGAATSLLQMQCDSNTTKALVLVVLQISAPLYKEHVRTSQIEHAHHTYIHARDRTKLAWGSPATCDPPVCQSECGIPGSCRHFPRPESSMSPFRHESRPPSEKNRGSTSAA